MFCPKDGKTCCDDLCYGGGCLQMDGAPMLYKCECGALVSDDDHMDCTCEESEHDE